MSSKRAMEQSLRRAVTAAAKSPAREWDYKSLLVAGTCVLVGLVAALLVKYLSARAAAAAADDDEHELRQLATTDTVGGSHAAAAAPRTEAAAKSMMPPFERVRRLKRLQSKQAYRMQLVRTLGPEPSGWLIDRMEGFEF